MSSLELESHRIPMVGPTEGFKVLGTRFTLRGRTSAEVRARIGAAWGKFKMLWPLLGRKGCDLVKKLRLFDTCVGQTLLWCNESWILTVAEQRVLRSTQKWMLRRIAGNSRRPDEPWLDWIRRSTRVARARALHAGVRMWVEHHLRCKWQWAGHVMRMTSDRLARRAFVSRDLEWYLHETLTKPSSLVCRRSHSTYWCRWEDDFRKFAARNGWAAWQSRTQSREAWNCWSTEFVRWKLHK